MSQEKRGGGGEPGPDAKRSRLIPDPEAKVRAALTAAKFEKIYFRGHDEQYKVHRYQYGMSSHHKDGYMDPLAIIYPSPKKVGQVDDEVRAAIKLAIEQKISIAVRTGGHQYSGASSTTGNNIQLDLSQTYPDFEVIKGSEDATERPLVRVGVSFPLRSLNERLGKAELFVPHGQCSHVHVGGHAHTGGYGQLGRAFGLFADHIEQVEVWTAKAVEDKALKPVVARRDSDEQELRDLFYGVLGGSPGNFGVLTHVWLRARRDRHHPDSRGLKLVMLYDKDKVEKLLEIKADMAADVDLEGDFDLCITVMSLSDTLETYFHDDEDNTMKKYFEKEYGEDDIPFWPPSILVYAQWANVDGKRQFRASEAAKYFRRIRYACGFALPQPLYMSEYFHTPMSKLTREWVFLNVREFRRPYNKRTWVTNSARLNKTGWAAKTAERIDMMQRNDKRCKVVVQIQHFGGKNSAFAKDDGRTSYSWRDSTVVCVLDAFYHANDPESKKFADDWQAGNDDMLIGPDGCFSDLPAPQKDRRVLWGSYGELNLDSVWQAYYEDENKYNRLVGIRNRVDPRNVFRANPFCIGKGPTPQPLEVLEDLAASDKDLAPRLLGYMDQHAKSLID